MTFSYNPALHRALVARENHFQFLFSSFEFGRFKTVSMRSEKPIIMRSNPSLRSFPSACLSVSLCFGFDDPLAYSVFQTRRKLLRERRSTCSRLKPDP